MCEEEAKNTKNSFKDGNEVVDTDRVEMVTKKGTTKRKTTTTKKEGAIKIKVRVPKVKKKKKTKK